MGKRGPKPRFLDVACPNEECTLFGVAGNGNVTVYGTMALKMAMRGMSVLGIAEILKIKPSTASTWVSRAGMHCEKVNKVVLNDVETPKVEMDELGTFVEKNVAQER